MDNLITLIREWNHFGQFLFLLLIAFIITIISMVTFGEIAKFFNQTLPIIFRGWPPKHIDISEKDTGEEDKD